MDQILKDLGLFGLAVAGVAWVVKTVISHVLSKDIENHKRSLESIGERSLESFKAQLTLAAKEHEIRFARLHEKRAEILQDFFCLLQEAHLRKSVALLSFDDWSGLKVDQVKKDFEVALKTIKAAEEKFQENRLWFSESLCKTLVGFFSALSGPVRDIAFAIDVQKLSEDELRSKLQVLSAQRDVLYAILGEIEHEFRSLLGSSEDFTNGLHT